MDRSEIVFFVVVAVGAGSCRCEAPVRGAHAVIQATPDMLDFGAVPVGTSKALTLALSNSGSAPIDVLGAAIQSDPSSAFQVGAFSVSRIAPGGAASVPMTFTPAGTGSVGAILVIHNDSLNSPELDVPLLGHGVVASADAGRDGGSSPDAGIPDASPSDGSVADASVEDAGGPDASITQPVTLRWLKTAPGMCSMDIDVGELPDGSVALSFEYASQDGGFVLGAGEAGQTVLSGSHIPAVAWLNGTSGDLLAVQQVALPAPAAGWPGGWPGSAQEMNLAVGDRGEVYVGGWFALAATFFPGTMLAQIQNTAFNPYDGTWYDAEDPFVVQYGGDRAAAWLVRGTTPGPLTTGWTNEPYGVTAVPGGGVFVAGSVSAAGDQSGFQIGTLVFSASAESYFARWDASGQFLWGAQNTNAVPLGAAAAPDGSVYVIMNSGAGTALFSDTTPVPLPAVMAGGTAEATLALVKLDPTGHLSWARLLGSINDCSNVRNWPILAARPDGSVAISWCGALDVRDASGSPLAAFSAALPQWGIASFAADGTVQWARYLGDAFAMPAWLDATAADSSGSVWAAVHASPGTPAVEIDNGPPPALPIVADAGVEVLYQIGTDGKRDQARVLAVDLDPAHLRTTRNGDFLAAGSYYDWQAPQVPGADGGLEPLPPPSGSATRAAGFYMRFRP